MQYLTKCIMKIIPESILTPPFFSGTQKRLYNIRHNPSYLYLCTYTVSMNFWMAVMSFSGVPKTLHMTTIIDWDIGTSKELILHLSQLRETPKKQTKLR